LDAAGGASGAGIFALAAMLAAQDQLRDTLERFLDVGFALNAIPRARFSKNEIGNELTFVSLAVWHLMSFPRSGPLLSNKPLACDRPQATEANSTQGSMTRMHRKTPTGLASLWKLAFHPLTRPGLNCSFPSMRRSLK
jgi:hypothetical protein